MPMIKVNCAACGAPIAIPPDFDREFITCASCGTSLQVEHGEGYFSLKVAEKIAQSIEDSGHATRQVIQESSQLQRHELQRIQLTQELSTTEMRLTNLQSEIRMLNRGAGTPTIYAQLQNLYRSEYQVMDHIRCIKGQMLDPETDPLSERMEALQWELAWIPQEILSVTHSNHPHRQQLAAGLQQRTRDIHAQVGRLRLEGMRSNFPSFKMENPPLDDQEKLLACLQQLKQDEQKLRPYQGTPEGATLYRELTGRQRLLADAWQKLEGVRLGESLVSPAFKVDIRSLESAMEHTFRPVGPSESFRANLRDNLQVAIQHRADGMVVEYPYILRYRVVLGVSAGVVAAALATLVLMFRPRSRDARR